MQFTSQFGDLTGATVKLQARIDTSSRYAIIDVDGALVDAAQGIYSVTFPSSVTLGKGQDKAYYYDIKIQKSDKSIHTDRSGMLTIDPRTTDLNAQPVITTSGVDIKKDGALFKADASDIDFLGKNVHANVVGNGVQISVDKTSGFTDEGSIGQSDDPKTKTTGSYYVTEQFIGAPTLPSGDYVGMMLIQNNIDSDNGRHILYFNTDGMFTLTKEAGGWDTDWKHYRAGVSFSDEGSMIGDFSSVDFKGAGAGAVDLGAFTGSTIADNESIKDALQTLETKAEADAQIYANNRSELTTQTNTAGTWTTFTHNLNEDRLASVSFFDEGNNMQNLNGSVLWRPKSGDSNSVEVYASQVKTMTIVFRA